jgi:hypothetical protein
MFCSLYTTFLLPFQTSRPPTNCFLFSNSHRTPAHVARDLLPQFSPQQSHGLLQVHARFRFRELEVFLYLLHDLL